MTSMNILQLFEELERQADAALGSIDDMDEKMASFYSEAVTGKVRADLRVAELARQVAAAYLARGETVPVHVVAAARPVQRQEFGEVPQESQPTPEFRERRRGSESAGDKVDEAACAAASTGRILVVENDDAFRVITHAQLRFEGFNVVSTDTAESAIQILGETPQDLVITEINLPGLSGLELLKRIRTEHPETTVIVLTAYATVKTAVDAMKFGAYDYLAKPAHPSEVRAIVKRALDQQRLGQEVRVLRSSLDRKNGFEEIIGSSDVLREALDAAARMAATDATVLISGETGTGKELVAKAIHMRSNRHDRAFMTINCGAIPKELLESELFGYVKGSFTGDLTHKRGKVEMAEGGTIFLDEIDKIPLELQVRILRLVQDCEIEKVGASSPTRVNVRIIAATNRDLATMVKQGTFREDLYYRLLVVPIKLPPLRERNGDIEELVQHFFARSRTRYGRTELTMRADLMHYLSQYSWHGNVRELENTIERMVVLSSETEITPADLPDSLHRGEPAGKPHAVTLPEGEVSLEAVEKQMILDALKRCNGNMTQAARYLNLSRRALAYLLEKYVVGATTLKASKHGVA